MLRLKLLLRWVLKRMESWTSPFLATQGGLLAAAELNELFC